MLADSWALNLVLCAGPSSTFHHSHLPLSIELSSFATNLVINHDDSIDTDVHAIAMYTVVDGGFVHDAEPLLEFVVRLLGCANIWAYPKRSHTTTILGSCVARRGVG